ncbi:hypothetical protein BVG16_26400 [Paenibacillus selenitireducens]|uniref:Glycosyl hydrolase n=1 Tax=Paenibacillus selenitireducens TaxID=1324314 RepID=A0A1T2X274_9BACL|nr:glycoside hydrolase [Paenibacillus selenitireducens]OPA73974.1 hypothetical protein BVG16_26400 [Paenibacillus selenitireducens]
MNKKQAFIIVLAILIVLLAIACALLLTKTPASSSPPPSDNRPLNVSVKYQDFTFDVHPETAEIMMEHNGVKESVSLPLPPQEVTELKRTEDTVSWSYPQAQIQVAVEKKDAYLHVSFTSTGAKQFTWPSIQGESYILPLGEGKFVPSQDPHWKSFLAESDLNFIESFSMRFFAVNKKDFSILYIADDMYNDMIHFETEPKIQMSLTHEFPSINPNKTYGFRLYATKNDPVEMTQIYRAYIQEKGEFKTLKEKAAENPNVEKLYGAPHIYLWNNQVLTQDNIHWQKLVPLIQSPLFQWVEQLLNRYGEDGSHEFKTVLADIAKNGYVDKYQKQTITTALNNVLMLPELYNKSLFTSLDENTQALLSKGISNLSEQELYTFNKDLLKHALQDLVDPIAKWGADSSTDILKDMHESGIQKAWIGLPNWANGLKNPTMVQEASQLGYLIGPYDSYHSIQKNASQDWNTASFDDKSLYDNATIENQQGEKIKGFLGRGRKLNPTLSLPSVQQRVSRILQNGISFNSWFIDCDATGEIYDDYAKNHPTTAGQDLAARLARMQYIANEKHMVIGSEGGNDFASSTIAFAHGIETPVIQWSDPDMRENKTSPYYVGGYWSAGGGTPERYSKTVPIKKEYKPIYIDPVYNLPLYKLVYNDAVITTHHWEWGSLKIQDEIGNRMLTELLYNVPPLYHIDKESWQTNKEMITSYLKVWSPFHEQAVTQPMTSFDILSQDRLVQRTVFGDHLQVIVNYSNQNFEYNKHQIHAKTAVIYNGDATTTFDVSSYK